MSDQPVYTDPTIPGVGWQRVDTVIPSFVYGVKVNIVRSGMVPDGQVIMMGKPTGYYGESPGPGIMIGVYEPHAIAKRIVREGLADVLAWLTPERRPNMTTGQEILDRLKGDPS